MLQEFNVQHNIKVSANIAVSSWWRVWLKPARAIALT